MDSPAAGNSPQKMLYFPPVSCIQSYSEQPCRENTEYLKEKELYICDFSRPTSSVALNWLRATDRKSGSVK